MDTNDHSPRHQRIMMVPSSRIRQRRHRRLRRLATTIVVLTTLIGGLVWWAATGSTTAPVRPTADPARPNGCPASPLQVVAAPDITPVVEAATRGLSTTGGCATVTVRAEEPAVTAGAARQPDVWIPSSSAWLHIAAARHATYRTLGEPVAYTPIVLAAPRTLQRLYADKEQTTWSKVVDGVTTHRIPAVSMPNPQRSTVGLLSVYAVGRAMARTTTDPGIAQLRALTLRSRLTNPDTDSVTLLDALTRQSDPRAAAEDTGIFPVTEQQLTAYQHGAHAIPLVGAYPSDVRIDADYPYAVAATADQRQAQRLRQAITARDVVAAGFRTFASDHALETPIDAAPLVKATAQWSSYRTMPFQVLLLVDASGSMIKKTVSYAGHTISKADLLRRSGVSAAQLFGEDTSLGMWYFATTTPTSPAHTQAVTFGPLTANIGGTPRRQVLGDAIAGYRAIDQSGTPLYQSVLDAVATMREKAKPGTVTLVVVLTDGDDRHSRYAMPQQTFLAKLKAGSDPARPVPIIAVGYGSDADMSALNTMATATAGTAVAASNPADLASAMAQAFLAAHRPA